MLRVLQVNVLPFSLKIRVFYSNYGLYVDSSVLMSLFTVFIGLL